jgi:hypothetical protein
MNWVCPIAPAHDPTSWVRAASLVLQDVQRGHQLRGAVAHAPPAVGERGQRTNHIAAADVLPVTALHAPDGRHDPGIDAIGALHLGQDRFAAQQLLALLDILRAHALGQILPDRGGEFRLRHVQLVHRRIGGDAAKGEIERALVDALGTGIAAERRQPLLEIRLGGGVGWRAGSRICGKTSRGGRCRCKRNDHQRCSENSGTHGLCIHKGH